MKTSNTLRIQDREANLATLLRSPFAKMRSGAFVALLFILHSIGWGIVAVHFLDTEAGDPIDSVIWIGIIMALVSVVGFVLFILAVRRWSNATSDWLWLDHRDDARADLSKVDDPEKATTIWQLRHSDDKALADVRDVYRPFSQFSGAETMNAQLISALGASLLAVGAIFSMIGLVDAANDSYTNAALFSVSSVISHFIMLGMFCIYIYLISTPFKSPLYTQIERQVYPLPDQDRLTLNEGAASAFTKVVILLPLIAYVVFSAVRATTGSSAAIWIPSAIVIIALIAAIIHYSTRWRTIPIVFSNTESLTTNKPKRIAGLHTKDKDQVEIVPKRRSLSSLQINRKDIKSVRLLHRAQIAGPKQVAIIGHDDVIVVLSGNGVTKQLLEWYK